MLEEAVEKVLCLGGGGGKLHTDSLSRDELSDRASICPKPISSLPTKTSNV